MKFFFSTYDAIGHAFPVSAIVRELLDRGHKVLWMTGDDTKALAIKSGAEHISTSELTPLDNAAKPRLHGPLSPARMRDAIVQKRTLAQVHDFGAALENFSADCAVVDLAPSGPQALYELGKGPIYAVINVFPLWADSSNIPMGFTGLKPPSTVFEYILLWMKRTIDNYFYYPSTVMAPIMRDRLQLGLPAIPQTIMRERFSRSEWLNLQLSSPRMEFFDDAALKRYSNVHFVGPMIGGHEDINDEDTTRWSRLLDHETIVFATQGTFATDPFSLILPTIRALSKHQHLHLVVATQHADDLRKTQAIPANCSLEKYVPYELLLSRASLFITNGGYGGVKQALLFGVPMICAGTTEDKADVAARVEHNGAGLDLKTDTPSEGQIEDAVLRILGDKEFQKSAEKIGAEFKTLGGASHAADLLEELVRTKAVVSRKNLARH